MGDVAYAICEAAAKEVLVDVVNRSLPIVLGAHASYKKHHAAAAIGELVGYVREGNAGCRDAVHEENFFAVFRPEFVYSYRSILWSGVST